MSAPTGGAETSNPARPRAPSRTVLSAKDRVDSILESARARKAAMGDSSNSGPRLRGCGERTAEAESSADEETSIVRRSSSRNMNYQSTQSREGRTSTTNTRRSGRTSEPEPERHEQETGAGEHTSWWARLASEYGSVELENKGSVARDHLALERTFLAWLRTSLAFASIGIAITQLFRLNVSSAGKGGNDAYRHLRQMGKPLGATFLGISIAILFLGFNRYFEGQHWIIKGKFPASRGSIALVAAITFALMVTSLVIVVVVEPTAFEN